MENRTEIPNRASQIVRGVNRLIEAELARLGLSGLVPSHGDVLATLFARDGIPMREVAQSVRRTRATATALVDKLEKLGMVERIPDPHDARGVLLRLTGSGRALKPEFDRISDLVAGRVCAGLTDKERKTAEALLRRIAANFQAD